MKKQSTRTVVTRTTFPQTDGDPKTIYHFNKTPKRPTSKERSARDAWYYERTDRNAGYLVREIEQPILRNASVAVVGTGGMGGPLMEIFARLGIGTIHAADNGHFDISNIGRQPGATKSTIGRQKALATGRRIWSITDDFDLWIYPKGLSEDTAELLLKDRDVVMDMVEFWAIADRILLHRRCAEYGTNVINCNSVGHSTFITRFDYAHPPSARRLGAYCTLLEKAMKLSYEEACVLQARYEAGTATQAEKLRIMEAVFTVFVPKAPEYFVDRKHSSVHALKRRLLEEGKAPILSTNPPFAAGVCATEAFFEIMRAASPVVRNIPMRKPFPYVTHLDIGHQTFTEFKIPC